MFLVVIIYIDDLIILSNTMVRLKLLKERLELRFEMSDLEEFHYYLDVEFIRNRKSKIITLKLSMYSEEVCEHSKCSLSSL